MSVSEEHGKRAQSATLWSADEREVVALTTRDAIAESGEGQRSQQICETSGPPRKTRWQTNRTSGTLGIANWSAS
jgi:hypothetical protein